MNSAPLSRSRGLISKNARAGVVFSLLAISTVQLCWGDQLSPASASPPSANPLISTLGQRANLGNYAEIEVPKGYRFIDSDAAGVLLQRMGNPVSSGLVGVLIPDGGKWWAVMEFNEVGYVKELDPKNEDFEAILKAVQNRTDTENREQGQGPARILSVNWQIEPRYDADARSLEWAFLAEGQSGKVVNHTIALFGRRGVLNITAIEPYQASQAAIELVPLSDLVKKITFKEDQRYADYHIGDKVANGGLKELVMGDQPMTATPDQAAARSVPNSVNPMYSVVGGSVVLAGGLLAYGQLRKKKAHVRSSYANGHAVPALQANGANGRHGAARPRKVFNYHKFYSDMVLQCSGHSYGWVAPANGHSHPRAAEPVAPAAAAPAMPSQALANANLELIACQNNLIEEQRNLMREQARIIEEKAKLIKEYNQLMEKWSQDIENQFSLKLD